MDGYIIGGSNRMMDSKIWSLARRHFDINGASPFVVFLHS